MYLHSLADLRCKLCRAPFNETRKRNEEGLCPLCAETTDLIRRQRPVTRRDRETYRCDYCDNLVPPGNPYAGMCWPCAEAMLEQERGRSEWEEVA